MQSSLMCCFLCSITHTDGPSLTCDKCKAVSACSEYHLSFHSHQEQCFPFKLKDKPLVGRCVVASRHIAPGEVILFDSTSIYGEREGNEFIEIEEGCHPVPRYLGALARLLLQRSRDRNFQDLTELLIHHKSSFDIKDIKGAEYLQEHLKSDSQEILRCQSLLDINALSLQSSPGTRGFFPIFSFLSHSCQNNCRHVTEKMGDRYVVKLYSQRSIDPGEELSITYTNLLRPTHRRRAHLMNVWRFLCSCERCSDPTECQSFIGGLVCTGCRKGTLLQNGDTWKCGSCGKNVEHEAVEGLIDSLESLLNQTPRKVKDVQDFLTRIEPLLHPNHYLHILGKRILMQLLPLNPAEDNLCTRISLCHELMGVFDKLDGGLSSSRGCTLFELGKSLMAKGNVHQGITFLKEAEYCLEMEVINDGVQGKILSQIRQTLKMI